MATTGTYAFNPSAGDVVLNAFRPCGVRRVDITTEHLEDAYYWAQMVAVDFSNRQPNQWQIETLDFALTAGVAEYNLPSRTVAVNLAWLTGDPTPGLKDRPLSAMSMTDWGSLPDKAMEAVPTSYVFELLSPTPTITLWPVPNQIPAYGMKVMICRQMQDVALAAGTQLDTPFRFLEAFTLALTARLAMIYKPEVATTLDAAAQKAFDLAAGLDQERVLLNIAPTITSYYPR